MAGVYAPRFYWRSFQKSRQIWRLGMKNLVGDTHLSHFIPFTSPRPRAEMETNFKYFMSNYNKKYANR